MDSLHVQEGVVSADFRVTFISLVFLQSLIYVKPPAYVVMSSGTYLRGENGSI